MTVKFYMRDCNGRLLNFWQGELTHLPRIGEEQIFNQQRYIVKKISHQDVRNDVCILFEELQMRENGAPF